MKKTIFQVKLTAQHHQQQQQQQQQQQVAMAAMAAGMRVQRVNSA